MKTRNIVSLSASALFLIIPLQTYAAEDACVSLLVGAGYAAEMRIVSGDFKTDWSGSFPIGKTKCQSLDGVPVGKKFTVEVHAILGKTESCTPSITHSEGEGSITFQAWGTTLNVHCEMPSTTAAYLMEQEGEDAKAETPAEK
jgi:hypothetical protein